MKKLHRYFYTFMSTLTVKWEIYLNAPGAVLLVLLFSCFFLTGTCWSDSNPSTPSPNVTAKALQLAGTRLQLKGDLRGAVLKYRQSLGLQPNKKLENIVLFLEQRLDKSVKKVLFEGNLGDQWNELAAFGGDFKKFVRIEDNVLVVDVPEGNSWGKTGIRSVKPLLKIPEKQGKFAEKLIFSFGPKRSTDFVLAIIPANWDGNLEWRSHHIRVGLKNSSSLTLWIKGREVMRTNLTSGSLEQIGIIVRPDRLVLVTDGTDTILLQGYLPDNLPLYKDGYRISVLTHAPENGMKAKLVLKKIDLEHVPYEELAKAENDPTIWLDKTQKTVLFDGRILDKRWSKYQIGKGSNFSQHVRFVGGHLFADVPKGIGWGKVGIMSSIPLVWLDKFGKGAETRVRFNFDPDQTTGFVVALASMNASAGNEPSEPRALLYWRKNENTNTTKASFFLTPNKPWKPLWEQEFSNKMPEEVSFILTPGGIQIEAPGISKDIIPWELAAASQSFRIYVYSQPEKYKEPVKMALKQILLERKAGEPVEPPTSQKGVESLPVKVLFDGKINEWWEAAGVAGAEFSKFGHFENDQMRVDVPSKISNKARAGLLSKKPIINFNERILSTSHKLKLNIDPQKSTGFEILFHPGKHVDMWGNNFKAAMSLVRCSEGPCAGKYTLLLQNNRNPNHIWSRTINADWVEKKWDGRLTIETGNRWMAVHLSGGPSVRSSGFNIGKNSKLYMTVYSRNYKNYGPAKFALEKITSEWVMPDGMTHMDRFVYVDDEDFDADAFLDNLADELSLKNQSTLSGQTRNILEHKSTKDSTRSRRQMEIEVGREIRFRSTSSELYMTARYGAGKIEVSCSTIEGKAVRTFSGSLISDKNNKYKLIGQAKFKPSPGGDVYYKFSSNGQLVETLWQPKGKHPVFLRWTRVSKTD
ncbi:hypothetical protein JWG39_09805 [Desulforhopalus vacuolatus]|uniref:hypothetical protein n=1 Tax=Desulforhopalus vacuolatus TaxID=40414 RepID=UPI001965641B|nr:hypothetical protein [Desulforhopalus vacuolatus]MBM9520108.1 hypothetical protein [Desulforhopalus vacuolatus]